MQIVRQGRLRPDAVFPGRNDGAGCPSLSAPPAKPGAASEETQPFGARASHTRSPVGASPRPPIPEPPRRQPERPPDVPGQRGTETRILTKQVNIRLTPEEHERLQAEAVAAGITLAELTRRRLLGLHITARVDAELIRELRRLGGLAKIAIRTLHMAETGRLVLRDIRSAIAHLAVPS